MKTVLLAALLASASSLALAANDPPLVSPTGPATGASLSGQHQQGQAYIQGTNGCEVSMWVDPAQIKGNGQQVTIHNCKQ